MAADFFFIAARDRSYGRSAALGAIGGFQRR
jgi:hypothetical protein